MLYEMSAFFTIGQDMV